MLPICVICNLQKVNKSMCLDFFLLQLTAVVLKRRCCAMLFSELLVSFAFRLMCTDIGAV